MISFNNGGRLVEAASELPDLAGARTLYLDFETTSGDPKLKSTNPWRHCEIAGAAVTADEEPGAWYVPVGHNDRGWNVDRDAALKWLAGLLRTCGEWCNHNVKYDAHVAANAGLPVPDRLVCTLTLAKVVDSSRGYGRSTYTLDSLSKDWLGEDVSELEGRVRKYLAGCAGRGSKDYGDVPADVLGKYACQDVITGRRLRRHIMKAVDPQCYAVRDMEIALTPVLFDMEREGLRVDPTELKKKELTVTYRLLQTEQELHERLGFPMRPHVNDDCFELLCNRHGLPVLARTDEGNPSFDKDALVGYAARPEVLANPELRKTVDELLNYRELNTLNSLFIRKYSELHVDGVLYPTYNQAVRTGRMSCSEPNSQQLSKAAKELVHPPPGCSFISADYSQIEFRLIVHYIKNAAIIAAYLEDPSTDFHRWVAEMCGIDRDPAKNVNFAMGYGAGRDKILAMLASNPKLVEDLMGRAEGDPRRFHALCRERAKRVYDKYHATLPELRRTAWRASQRVKAAGRVFNLYGRHLHLPRALAFRAFNRLIQSSAADLMKERTVATSPRHDPWLRDRGVTQVASVHDETLFVAPTPVARDPDTWAHIAAMMEAPTVELRVPVRVDIGVSERSWREAGSDEAQVDVRRTA